MTRGPGQKGWERGPAHLLPGRGSPYLPTSRSPHPASRPPATSTVLGPILNTRRSVNPNPQRQGVGLSYEPRFQGPITGRRAELGLARTAGSDAGDNAVGAEEHQGRGSPGKATGPSWCRVTTARGSLLCEMPLGRALPLVHCSGQTHLAHPSLPPSPHIPASGAHVASPAPASRALQLLPPEPRGPRVSGEGPPTASSHLYLESDGATDTHGEMPALG